MVNSKQVTSKIIKDIEQNRYQLKKIEEELSSIRKERLSRWIRKIEKSKEETQEKKMSLLFGLGKELQGDYTRGGSKKDKTTARQIFASFGQMYPWMPHNKEWKLQHFYQMNKSQVKEIAKVWISTELNRIEGESLWRNPSSSTAT